MIDIRLGSGDTVLTISRDGGGRMAGLRVGDLDVIGRGGNGLYEWGCFALAPFAGRVRRGRLTWQSITHQLPITFGPHAIHGVTVDRPWQVLDLTANTARLSCPFDARWPWPGHAESAFTLAEDGLEARLEVHAEREPMPAWIGWHPWFSRRLARGGPVQLDLKAGGMLARDKDGIPDGTVVEPPAGPWDDCFTDVSWPIRLTWDEALTLSVEGDAGYAVVYDERETAVCAEPQTGPPDAVALDRHAVVEPGRPLALAMSWRWVRLA